MKIYLSGGFFDRVPELVLKEKARIMLSYNNNVKRGGKPDKRFRLIIEGRKNARQS